MGANQQMLNATKHATETSQGTAGTSKLRSSLSLWHLLKIIRREDFTIGLILQGVKTKENNSRFDLNEVEQVAGFPQSTLYVMDVI